MRIVSLCLAAIMGQSAMATQVEHLGTPCRAKNILAGRVVADRATGREWFVLTNTNEATGMELLFVDPEHDTGKLFACPAGQGSWALDEVPGDRLVVGTYYDGRFMVFDLKQMKFIKTADFPGESYIWNLAIGADGRIYGGTYGGGKLGALDLATYAVEDLGAPAPPNMYLRQVSATPDGRILCSLGMDKPTTLLFDPATKRFEPPPARLQGVGVGVTWNGYFLAGSRAFRGKDFEVVDPPPFPTPPADRGGWSVDTYMTTNDVLFLRQGNAVYRHAKSDEELTRVADLDLRGGRLLAGARDGSVLGVRGQDYFVIKPGDTELRLKPIPVESGARPTLFLRADDPGRLWGGPHFGQTLFWMDTRTRKVVNTGTVCDAGGEVYDATFANGKVYAASYAGGDITEYDPDEPWDQWNHNNPKPLARVGPAYIRPTGGIITGPDGKLYSGWMARYSVYGGAVAITDPATGDTEIVENPLGEQAVEGLAVDGRFAYVGTSLGANGLPRKPDESPRFGVMDLATKQIVYRRTFGRAHGVRAIVYDGTTERVAMLVDGKLRLFDIAERRFVRGPAGDLRNVTSRSMAAPGDGWLYYGREHSLVALDLATAKAARVAEVPDDITCVTVAADGTVYVSCEEDVYAVRATRR
ncbi:MAG: hypothetical protein JSV65_09870 [Armatimonadota bacterium]|nr:MAG: hypothetical protein JSV65_09870 [Armatimonadota bacterium]